MQHSGDLPQACTQLHYQVSSKDLPLSCPPRLDRVWDAHPRVYLPIEETGSVLCPYCGTKYVLKNEASLEQGPEQTQTK